MCLLPFTSRQLLFTVKTVVGNHRPSDGWMDGWCSCRLASELLSMNIHIITDPAPAIHTLAYSFVQEGVRLRIFAARRSALARHLLRRRVCVSVCHVDVLCPND